jgi:hypothetical protein
MKLGAARQKAPSAWRLVAVELAEKEATFRYRLRRDKPDRLAERLVGARVATCCAPISRKPIPRSCGTSICSSSRRKRPSRTSRGIWPSVPSSINSIDASRHIGALALLFFVIHATFHAIRGRPYDKVAAAGEADLSLVEEGSPGSRAGCGLDVRIVQHDVGIVAAKLENDALELSARDRT